MRQVVFDSNAVDPLADIPGAYEALEAAVDAGKLKILYTHVNIDELAEIPDLDRRRTLLLLLVSLGDLVPTGATAVDYSRLNFCRISDESDDFELMRSKNIKHTRRADRCDSALRAVRPCDQRTSVGQAVTRTRHRSADERGAAGRVRLHPAGSSALGTHGAHDHVSPAVSPICHVPRLAHREASL